MAIKANCRPTSAATLNDSYFYIYRHQEAVADPFGAYTVILIYCLIVSFILNVAYLAITKFASLLF